jgi:HK97 family phage portal protein
MARKLFNFTRRRDLINRITDLETRAADFDLKGETLLDYINSNTDGVTVTQETSMKFTGVLAAVSLRSKLLASFPQAIFKLTKDGREELTDDPLHKILAYQPNPFMNAFTFWELVNTHLDLWGNAFVYISRHGGNVRQLTPVMPSKVKIIAESGKLIYRVSGTGDKVLDGDHSPDKFLHFKDISFDGIIGQSRISLAKDAIALGMSQEKFGKEFYDKGGHSKGMLETDQSMGDDAYNTFKKRWQENANFGTPLLEHGLTYKAIPIPMGDAEFIGSRAFQIQDIARIFDVPPHLLGDLSRATFSNIEHSFLEFTTISLRPMVKRYEHELEAKLLGDDLGKKIIRFNLEGMLRGDSAARAAYYAALKQNKIATTNEIRKIEGMNPSEDPSADKLENPATSSDKNMQDEEN